MKKNASTFKDLDHHAFFMQEKGYPLTGSTDLSRPAPGDTHCKRAYIIFLYRPQGLPGTPYKKASAPAWMHILPASAAGTLTCLHASAFNPLLLHSVRMAGLACIPAEDMMLTEAPIIQGLFCCSSFYHRQADYAGSSCIQGHDTAPARLSQQEERPVFATAVMPC